MELEGRKYIAAACQGVVVSCLRPSCSRIARGDVYAFTIVSRMPRTGCTEFFVDDDSM